jgi:galactose mutarotase-like enzyme
MGSGGESDVIELSGAGLVVRCDPNAGATIAHLGPDWERNLLFHEDWVSPLKASRSMGYGSAVLDWLSEYRGGWQEMFPNAGDPCDVMGVPLGFHGEVSQARWEVLDVGPAHARLRCAARLPIVLERTMRAAADRPVLRIEERITNESDLEIPFVWGHHPAFRSEPTTRIDLPAGDLHVSPAMTGPQADLEPGSTGRWPFASDRTGEAVDLRVSPLPRRLHRLCYLPDVREGWAALRHPHAGEGLGLAWDSSTFPHVWFWQETGTDGFPWYGRARLTAIEPNAAWPADGVNGAIERGQALRLAGGASREAWLTVALFTATDRAVTRVHRDGSIEHEEEEDR